MNFLDWVKKYKTAISFLIGLLTGLIGAYYKVQSRLDVIEYKLDTIQREAQKEYENIYDVFHRQKKYIDSKITGD